MLKEERCVPELNSNIKDHMTCYYCKLRHDKVEAGGVWHCPNFLCAGPGAAYFRGKLKSYRNIDASRHTVDHKEWVEEAVKYLNKEVPTEDKILRQKITKSITKFLKTGKL